MAVFRVNEGYSNELYRAPLQGRRTPVKITDHGGNIKQYAVCPLENELLTYLAIDQIDEESEYIYISTDLLCEVPAERTDIALGSIVFDRENVKSGAEVEFLVTVENIGTTELADCVVQLLGKDNAVLTELTLEEPLIAGELREASLNYSIPVDFAMQEFIVTVDANGTVTAVGSGTAVISVATMDGDLVALCTITVYHEYEMDEWVITKEATAEENGTACRTCSLCGSVEEKEYTMCGLAGTRVLLQRGLKIGYMVEIFSLAEKDYRNPSVIFSMNEMSSAGNYFISEDGDYNVFYCDMIAPQQMTDTITATLYVDWDGLKLKCETWKFSLADYCYEELEKFAEYDYAASYKRLLVDTLNYGAAAQKYTGYKTDNLANANLTEEQKAWGTQEQPQINTGENPAYNSIENPSARWLGAGVLLQEDITLRVKFSSENVENLRVSVYDLYQEWSIPSSAFEETENGYYIYLNQLTPSRWSDTLYLTIYDGYTAISDTLCYSVESYIYARQNDTDKSLVDMLNALLKYGYSAKAYIAEGGE